MATWTITCFALPPLWPYPQYVSSNSQAPPLRVSPCDIRYSIDSPTAPYIQAIIDFYLDSVFTCAKKGDSGFTIIITVNGKTVNLPLTVQQESYSLIVRQTNKWELFADEYTGFLRGFETFSQLFEQQNGEYAITGIPILIDDKPDFKWRGLLIDSSRHFLPVSSIKKTIDGLLFNKMNVLHWHITDEDSFPL